MEEHGYNGGRDMVWYDIGDLILKVRYLQKNRQIIFLPFWRFFFKFWGLSDWMLS